MIAALTRRIEIFRLAILGETDNTPAEVQIQYGKKLKEAQSMQIK